MVSGRVPESAGDYVAREGFGCQVLKFGREVVMFADAETRERGGLV